MPDLWVFPGGRVDDADAVAPIGDPFRAAALRETAEEAALRLDLGPESLPEIACWVTPVGERRRFHTRFFLAIAHEHHQETCPDCTEVVATRWIAPSAALAMHQAGQLPLAPPTWWTLRQLSVHSDTGTIFAWAQQLAAGPIPVIQPTLGTHAGRPAVFWDHGALWLQHHTTGPAWALVNPD